MDYEYGVGNFYYKSFIEQEKKEYTKFNFFGKNEKTEKLIDKKVKETEKQIWTRINEFIKKNKLEIINIESIVVYRFCSGGSIVGTEIISNDNKYGCEVIGHRIYYRKRIIKIDPLDILQEKDQ